MSTPEGEQLKETVEKGELSVICACTEGKNRSSVAAHLLRMKFPNLNRSISVLPDGLNSLQRFLPFNKVREIIAPNAEIRDLDSRKKSFDYKRFLRKAGHSILVLVISKAERRAFSEVIEHLSTSGFQIFFLEAHSVDDVFKQLSD